VIADPANTGCTCARHLRHQLATEPGVGQLALDEGGEQRVVVLGEHLREARCERRVVRAVGEYAVVAHCGHRDRGGGEPPADVGQHAADVGASAVDLVDEQQGGDAQALQRAHQDTGLCLHPFDGRQHEHRAVEDAEHALHLGDEVGVAGGVDQVDGDRVRT
jgi:hypothetical protein